MSWAMPFRPALAPLRGSIRYAFLGLAAIAIAGCKDQEYEDRFDRYIHIVDVEFSRCMNWHKADPSETDWRAAIKQCDIYSKSYAQGMSASGENSRNEVEGEARQPGSATQNAPNQPHQPPSENHNDTE